ncbi:MAG: hypothetical protein AAF415_13570 [Pseudomonadota bacterium]
MLKRGLTGPAAFARLAGMPAWAKIGAGSSALATLVALELLFDAIQGACACA